MKKSKFIILSILILSVILGLSACDMIEEVEEEVLEEKPLSLELKIEGEGRIIDGETDEVILDSSEENKILQLEETETRSLIAEPKEDWYFSYWIADEEWRNTAPEPDFEVEFEVAETYDEAKAVFDDNVVGETEVYLSTHWQKETNMGNLVTDAMRETADEEAEIAFTNVGGIRQPVEEGKITEKEVYVIHPWDNEVVMLEPITGEVLEKILEHSVSEYPDTFGGFLQISGFEFKFDPEAEPGDRVNKIVYENEQVQPDDEFTIITNDFLADGGDNYEWLEDKEVVASYDSLTEVIIDYLEENSPVSPEIEGRITSQNVNDEVASLSGRLVSETEGEIENHSGLIVLEKDGVEIERQYNDFEEEKFKFDNLEPGEEYILSIYNIGAQEYRESVFLDEGLNDVGKIHTNIERTEKEEKDGVFMLDIKTQYPPMEDENIRKALAYAIDKQELSDDNNRKVFDYVDKNEHIEKNKIKQLLLEYQDSDGNS